jgi:hypothetical protein
MRVCPGSFHDFLCPHLNPTTISAALNSAHRERKANRPSQILSHPPGARLESNGVGAPLDISLTVSRTFFCTLIVTEPIEQESLDVSLRQEIKFLRARSELNRWGRVAPMFAASLQLEEIPPMSRDTTTKRAVLTAQSS